MMDNELAKELKQAGFPQSVHYNERGVADFLETDANGKTTCLCSHPRRTRRGVRRHFQSVERFSFAPFLARGRQIMQTKGQHPPKQSPASG